MSENKLNEIIRTSLENIRDLVDVNTVIGDPITTANGTTIIPVSKVSMGFASGGLDIQPKKDGKNPPAPVNPVQEHGDAQHQLPFGGGGGTGVSVSPLAFLVIKSDGNVELLNVNMPASGDPIESIGSIIDRTPDIIARIKNLFPKKDKSDPDCKKDENDKSDPDDKKDEKDKK